MKKVIFAVCALAVCASALEFKQGVKLPPVDGSVYNGVVWVVK
jgi:hypothetical protein